MNMAVEQETESEDEVIEGEVVNTEVEDPEVGDEPKPGSEEGTGEEDGEEEDEVIVTIGDQTPPQDDDEHAQAPGWVKELRKTHRETVKKNRELEAKIKELEKPAAPSAKTLGPKPKINDSDIDYDTEVFEQKLAQWYEDKREVEAEQKKLEDDEKAQQDAWQEKLNAYGEQRSKLKVKDFEEAEEVVLSTFDQTQQGIIVQGADNPALVMYALGKNPVKVKEFSSIKDPVKFAFAVAKLEKDLKVTNRKAPPPEKKVTGTGPSGAVNDSTLERLRAEASKTGDFTKVNAYRRKQRQKNK